MNKSLSLLILWILIVFTGCSNQKDNSQTDQTSGPSTNLGLAKSPKENKDTNNSKSPSSDPAEKQTDDKKDKDPPCCHGAASIIFKSLDIEGKLAGFAGDFHPLHDYKGTLSILEGFENIEGHKLRVRAGMDGMDHGDIEFITKQTKPREFQIDGIVFTMPGDWNVAFEFIGEDNEVADACKCKIPVKK